MRLSPLKSSAGFTYIAALVMVIIMGVLLAQASQTWSMKMRREREVELLFRGTQVRDALRRWYKIKPPTPGAPPTAQQLQLQGPSPADLKALTGEGVSATAAKVHYLRPSALIDPITGKEWAYVKDASQKIVGVASTSELEPIKKANFPLDLDPADFEDKKKYSEWQFICNHFPKPAGTGGVTGLKTSGPGGSSPPGTSGTSGSTNPP